MRVPSQIGNPDGPLGSKYGKKLNAYRDVFGTDKWKTEIHALARKSIRDHERFLAHFDQVRLRYSPSSMADLMLTNLSFPDGIRRDSVRPFEP